MSYTICLAGKGGTGKTTIAALLVLALSQEKPGALLAVDADPATNLPYFLGHNEFETVSSIVEELQGPHFSLPSGMSKVGFLEYRIQNSIFETGAYDLLTMGHPEGPGCYCYVNNLMRGLLDKLGKSYPFILIDNAAGMEHFSRRTLRQVDLLLLVSDGTSAGMRSARDIDALTRHLKIKSRKKILVVNQQKEGSSRGSNEQAKPLFEADDVFVLPFDEKVLALSQEGGALTQLAINSILVKKVKELIARYVY